MMDTLPPNLDTYYLNQLKGHVAQIDQQVLSGVKTHDDYLRLIGMRSGLVRALEEFTTLVSRYKEQQHG